MKKKIFISTPMSSFHNDKEYSQFRNDILVLIEFLKNTYNVNEPYYAGKFAKRKSSFDTPSKSYINDLKALEKSDCFLFIYPKRSGSGSLIELGVSIAMDLPIIILTTDRDILPYMIREIDKVNPKASIFNYDKNINVSKFFIEDGEIQKTLHNILHIP
jgi:nucleoside 2-deoxyribosyltransferase